MCELCSLIFPLSWESLLNSLSNGHSYVERFPWHQTTIKIVCLGRFFHLIQSSGFNWRLTNIAEEYALFHRACWNSAIAESHLYEDTVAECRRTFDIADYQEPMITGFQWIALAENAEPASKIWISVVSKWIVFNSHLFYGFSNCMKYPSKSQVTQNLCVEKTVSIREREEPKPAASFENIMSTVMSGGLHQCTVWVSAHPRKIKDITKYVAEWSNER